VLVPAPSILSACIGGIVGTVLFLAAVAVMPLLGTPNLNPAVAIGSLLTSNAAAAVGIGMVILIIGGSLVVPALLIAMWSALPGSNVRFRGAVMKGLACGAAIWILDLVVIRPGLDAAAILLIGSILYGVAVALIAAMEQALSPLDTLGWRHHYHAAVGGKYLNQHRSIERR
jgi:hypothetical protein